MDEEKSRRELLHDLGNALQDKVALQYLLVRAAEHIERLAELVSDLDEKQQALEAAARLRHSAEL